MTTHPTRAALLAALLLPMHAVAQTAPADSTIAGFARDWSTGLGTPRCEDQPEAEEGPSVQCTWGSAQSEAPWLQHTAPRRPGGPSLVMWHRPTSDSLHAGRVVDSLDAAFVARGAMRRACGTGAVPAGRVTGTVWESDALVVHLSSVQGESGGPSLLVAATDQPSVMPMDVLCPRPQAWDGAAEPASTPALRRNAILRMVSFRLVADSALTVVHYRTDAPAADSAAVRRTLARRLARPRSLDGQLYAGAMPVRTTIVVIRPCYMDACPTFVPERAMTRAPGDLVFVRQTDRSWREQR